MSRAQRIIRDISFESETHDIYNPKFSSEDGDAKENTDDFADNEEAEGKICDERLSEMNPCDNSAKSNSSVKSNKTQLERCPGE